MVSAMIPDNSVKATHLPDYRVKTNFVFSELSKVKFDLPLDQYWGFFFMPCGLKKSALKTETFLLFGKNVKKLIITGIDIINSIIIQ